MTESAALLVDEVLSRKPMRQWVVSFQYPLRYLFVSRPEVMGKVLGIVYRAIATHLVKKVGMTHQTARTGAVTLILRSRGALILDIRFYMLFLDGVYVEGPDGCVWFRWVEVPTNDQITRLTQTMAQRIGRFLKREGLLERDAESSYLAGNSVDAGALGVLGNFSALDAGWQGLTKGTSAMTGAVTRRHHVAWVMPMNQRTVQRPSSPPMLCV